MPLRGDNVDSWLWIEETLLSLCHLGNIYKNLELIVFNKFNLLELELFSLKSGGFLLVNTVKELYKETKYSKRIKEV